MTIYNNLIVKIWQTLTTSSQVQVVAIAIVFNYWSFIASTAASNTVPTVTTIPPAPLPPVSSPGTCRPSGETAENSEDSRMVFTGVPRALACCARAVSSSAITGLSAACVQTIRPGQNQNTTTVTYLAIKKKQLENGSSAHRHFITKLMLITVRT